MHRCRAHNRQVSGNGVRSYAIKLIVWCDVYIDTSAAGQMSGQFGTRESSVPHQLSDAPLVLQARSFPQAIQHWIAGARHLGFEPAGQFDADAGAGRIRDSVRRLAGIGFQVEEFIHL